MNTLCALCPMFVFCEAFFHDADERNRQLQVENYNLKKESSVLKDRLIENGLEAGASIYMHGQRIDVEI